MKVYHSPSSQAIAKTVPSAVTVNASSQRGLAGEPPSGEVALDDARLAVSLP
jgi:hypothetical protein